MPRVNNTNGTHNKNGNTNWWRLPSLSRGMYKRVAEKVGCDPSYVSRVARGERESQLVSDALMAEIQRTWAVVNNAASRAKVATKRK
jgi:transcriptional regulator with XRE-family HTH domain